MGEIFWCLHAPNSSLQALFFIRTNIIPQIKLDFHHNINTNTRYNLWESQNFLTKLNNLYQTPRVYMPHVAVQLILLLKNLTDDIIKNAVCCALSLRLVLK